MIKVELNQQLLKGGQRLPDNVLKRALSVISKTENIKQDLLVSVAFVSKREIKKLNKIYRGKDKVTDVLSFPFDLKDVPAGMEDSIGEVLICYEQAKIQAKEMKHSVRDEVVFLLVHGVLHVLGYDHEIEKDARIMFPLQERILKQLKIDSRL